MMVERVRMMDRRKMRRLGKGEHGRDSARGGGGDEKKKHWGWRGRDGFVGNLRFGLVNSLLDRLFD